MVVENLLDSKSYFAGEMKESFLVIYEKLQQSNAFFKESGFEEVEGATEEYVKVLKDPGGESSLKSIKSYKIGQDYTCLDEALAGIKDAHSEIFK